MKTALTNTEPTGWRAHLAVAADLFPLMSLEELAALAVDIKANGMRAPIVLSAPDIATGELIDCRNRLDALELMGETIFDSNGRAKGVVRMVSYPGHDPYELALSLNVHRRHLHAEQRRELIAKLLKLKPETSNRQIAEQVKADHKTVGSVREEMVGRGEIPHVSTTTDTKGRQQPARKAAMLTPEQLEQRAEPEIQHIGDAVDLVEHDGVVVPLPPIASVAMQIYELCREGGRNWRKGKNARLPEVATLLAKAAPQVQEKDRLAVADAIRLLLKLDPGFYQNLVWISAPVFDPSIIDLLRAIAKAS